MSFLRYISLRQSKTKNKIYEKILYSVGFTNPALKFCAPNKQTPTPTFVSMPSKFWCWFRKTNTVFVITNILFYDAVFTRASLKWRFLIQSNPSNYLKIFETCSEWQQTVWNKLEAPRQNMAEIKKNRNISFSLN